jgi:GNAT superfamily N-acetyltransferase
MQSRPRARTVAISWSAEQRYTAAVEGPLTAPVMRPDTSVIARDDWYQLVTPSAPSTRLNEIAYSKLSPDDADAAIGAAIDTYHALEKPVKWCVGPWTEPTDFAARLARRGFTSWDVAGMGIATDPPFRGGRDVAVSEVDDELLAEYVAASVRGWGQPRSQFEAELTAYAGALGATPRIGHFFAARVDGLFVGTAELVVRPGYCYLTGGQVLEAARGRGVYLALLAARLEFLRQRGFGYAVTHARVATSAPILAAHGFETLFRSACWQLDP